MNQEEQYSIWLASRDLPNGWVAVGKKGLKAECLQYIEKAWTDMRPLSLRRHMDATRINGPGTIERSAGSSSLDAPADSATGAAPVEIGARQRDSVGVAAIAEGVMRSKNQSDARRSTDEGDEARVATGA